MPNNYVTACILLHFTLWGIHTQHQNILGIYGLVLFGSVRFSWVELGWYGFGPYPQPISVVYLTFPPDTGLLLDSTSLLFVFIC